MKSKATLSLIEQIIMILVFAIAAAASLKMFVYAETLSEQKEISDFAVTTAESAAEIIKHTRGDMVQAAALLEADATQEGLTLSCENGTVLTACAEDSGNPLLGCADISVSCGNETVYTITVYWQEAAE